MGNQIEAGPASEDNPKVRFEAFKADRVSMYEQGVVFVARKCKEIMWTKRVYKRALPPSLKAIYDLIRHRFEAEFRETQRQHLESHRQMKSWAPVPKMQVQGH